jgi:hypothetical protein
VNRAKTRKTSPQISIKDAKNLPWIERLLRNFGHGFIKKGRGNVFRWVISDYKDLIKFVELVNGKFRTPKIEALHRLMDWLNANIPYCNIPKLPIDPSPSAQRAGWFCRF